MVSDSDAKKIAKAVCNMIEQKLLPQLDDVMTLKDAAAYIGVSPKTLRNLGGKVSRVKQRGKWYYTKAGLNQYLLEQE